MSCHSLVLGRPGSLFNAQEVVGGDEARTVGPGPPPWHQADPPARGGAGYREAIRRGVVGSLLSDVAANAHALSAEAVAQLREAEYQNRHGFGV
jgi:hypothetical protein